MITLDQVSKSYDGVSRIINNLSFEVLEGEILMLLGSSGCGKSTILKILETIALSPKPVLIHCQYGKDRTGTIISLLLLLSGMIKREQIIAYYSSLGLHSKSGVIAGFLDYIKHCYGSVDGYIAKLGLTNNYFEKLKNLLKNKNDFA